MQNIVIALEWLWMINGKLACICTVPRCPNSSWCRRSRTSLHSLRRLIPLMSRTMRSTWKRVEDGEQGHHIQADTLHIRASRGVYRSYTRRYSNYLTLLFNYPGDGVADIRSCYIWPYFCRIYSADAIVLTSVYPTSDARFSLRVLSPRPCIIVLFIIQYRALPCFYKASKLWIRQSLERLFIQLSMSILKSSLRFYWKEIPPRATVLLGEILVPLTGEMVGSDWALTYDQETLAAGSWW